MWCWKTTGRVMRKARSSLATRGGRSGEEVGRRGVLVPARWSIGSSSVCGEASIRRVSAPAARGVVLPQRRTAPRQRRGSTGVAACLLQSYLGRIQKERGGQETLTSGGGGSGGGLRRGRPRPSPSPPRWQDRKRRARVRLMEKRPHSLSSQILILSSQISILSS